MDGAAIGFGEELQRAHPSLRLFTVHPDLGLEETEAIGPSAPHVRDLSVDWLALPFEEQAQRERDMLRGLLEYAAAGVGARFEAIDDYDADERTGELTADAIDALVARLPAWLLVERDGRTLMHAEGDGERAVGVWFDPWKVAALQEELMRAWWEPAQERRRVAEGRALPAPRGGGRVSRETRAWLYHAWERHGGAVASFAIAGLLAVAVSDTWVNLAIVFVLVLTIAATISDALKLWYESS